mgnify:CR=1 FL=1
MLVQTGETYNFSSDLNSNGTNRKHKSIAVCPIGVAGIKRI